jgi:hypothetical protein
MHEVVESSGVGGSLGSVAHSVVNYVRTGRIFRPTIMAALAPIHRDKRRSYLELQAESISRHDNNLTPHA